MEKQQNRIEIYSKSWCPYCAKAKALLKSKDLEYTEIDVTSDADREAEMIAASGRRSAFAYAIPSWSAAWTRPPCGASAACSAARNWPSSPPPRAFRAGWRPVSASRRRC